MTKLLFIIRDFKQGGIPRCLQSLLHVLNPDQFKVDVLCLYQDGPYKGQMKNCKVLPQDKLLFRLLSFGKNTSFINSPFTFICKVMNVLIGAISKKNLLHRKVESIATSLSGKYDVVIAYSEGICAQIAQNIQCEKKFVWIHNDYAFDCARGDCNTDFNYFNAIICVSKATEKSFLSVFPKLKNKVRTIYNIINQDFIIQSADRGDSNEIDHKKFNIISIGRICYQKNFKIIPKILSSIPQNIRENLIWYIIGDGPTEEVDIVRSEITKYGVADCCKLLGNKDNPYPYLKNANLFVLTSLYESYPTVLNEALVLGTPIRSIDIPPAHEMLDSSMIVSETNLGLSICDVYKNKKSDKQQFDVSNHNASVLNAMIELFEN